MLEPGRLLSFCAKSGHVCYLDELIKDGYNPNLLVLPKYWDPPENRPKRPMALKALMNPQPLNEIRDEVVTVDNIWDFERGRAVDLPFCNAAVGTGITIRLG